MKFLFPRNVLISFRIYSPPKVSKYVALSLFTYKAIQWVPIDLYSSYWFIWGLLSYARSFTVGKLFLE